MIVVIPKDICKEIFQVCHGDPTAGRFGYSRTVGGIREKF